MPVQRKRLRRERDRLAAHHGQPGPLGVAAVEQVQGGSGAEVGRSHAESGEAAHVHRSSAEHPVPERAEPAAGVDVAAPGVRDAHVGQLREGLHQMLGQDGEGLRVLGSPRVGVATQEVEGVVAAEQQPVVSRQPVVVELVGGVADPLPSVPAEAGAYVGHERLGHQRVVPDRHHVRPDRAPYRPPGRGGDQSPGRADPAVRGGDPDADTIAVQTGGRGVLEDAYAEPLGRRRQPPGQPGGVDQGHAIRVVDRGQVGR